MLVIRLLSIDKQVVFHWYKSIFSPTRHLRHPHPHQIFQQATLLLSYFLLPSLTTSAFWWRKHHIDFYFLKILQRHLVSSPLCRNQYSFSHHKRKSQTKKQYMTRARAKRKSKEVCATHIWRRNTPHRNLLPTRSY